MNRRLRISHETSKPPSEPATTRLWAPATYAPPGQSRCTFFDLRPNRFGRHPPSKWVRGPPAGNRHCRSRCAPVRRILLLLLYCDKNGGVGRLPDGHRRATTPLTHKTPPFSDCRAVWCGPGFAV